MNDAFLFEGLFVHLVVSSGVPNACRDRLIQPSAWKGNSANYFACIGFLGRWRELAQLSKKAGATTHTPALMIRSLWLSATQSRSLFSRSSCAPSSNDRLPTRRSW